MLHVIKQWPQSCACLVEEEGPEKTVFSYCEIPKTQMKTGHVCLTVSLTVFNLEHDFIIISLPTNMLKVQNRLYFYTSLMLISRILNFMGHT